MKTYHFIHGQASEYDESDDRPALGNTPMGIAALVVLLPICLPGCFALASIYFR